MTRDQWLRRTRLASVVVLALALLVAASACRRSAAPASPPTYASPDDAVAALSKAAKAGKLEDVLTIFGPEGQRLVDSSDPETGRRNLQVFTAAMAERWHLEDEDATHKRLVIGNEEWPFPIPIAKDGTGWRFDTAAGIEEILDRRIGRNELAVLTICRTYVAAQQLYARKGHDGRRAGLYAAAFRSDPGRENGLYWPARSRGKLSPLGDLVASAAAEGRQVGGSGTEPSPFHGYYFRILTGQGPAARGGPKSYVVNGELAGGFALVAWPARYDATGVMTFVVNQDGVIWQKDLGPDTDAAARGMTLYDPDSSWTALDSQP